MQVDEGRELTSLVASDVHPPVAQCSSSSQSSMPKELAWAFEVFHTPPFAASGDPTTSSTAKKSLTPVNGHHANPKRLIKLD